MDKTPEDIRKELAGHIEKLAHQCQESAYFSLERSLDVDWTPGGSYGIDDRFAELDRLFSGLLEELSRETTRPAIAKIARKSEFLEDRFEEMDSCLRNRPRRKRAAMPWEKFFRMGVEGGGTKEVRREDRLKQCCRTLGLPDSSPWTAIRSKVRSLLKEMHPDMRAGDRSQEGRMREILDAYEFLKQYHGVKGETGTAAGG